MRIVTLLCGKNHEAVWYSRLNLSRMVVGNTFLSAAILFMGNTFQRIKKLMDLINVSFISRTTFNAIQKKYLFPVIQCYLSVHDQQAVEY